MSKKREIYLLSDYKINSKEQKMDKILTEINELENNKQYYYAFSKLSNLISLDGTQEKYNDKFLNIILEHYDEIITQIKAISSGILLNEDEHIKYDKEIEDAIKYDFLYFNDCFDKLEVTLSQPKLIKIIDKKLRHNLNIIEKYSYLKDDYLKLIQDINNNKNSISKDEIYKTIQELNKRILDEKTSKLYYIYEYLDIRLIENNKIFECISKDRHFLNRYSFGNFDNLGISIGYSNNIILKYRYLFSLIKNKIDEIGKKNKKEEKDIEFVFNTFKDIFSSIKENRFEYMKYFTLIFSNIIFEGEDNITKIYDEKLFLVFSNFKILCEQFSINKNIDLNLNVIYETLKKKKIEFINENAKMDYNGKDIYLNLNDYSINSFIINLIKKKNKDLIFIKNHSKKFLCKDKIYDEYYYDFIELLKKICSSNIAEIMQSLHRDFKLFNSFYSNEKIKNDLFENRLKFYLFKYNSLYGITDKYLLEIYLSSIYYKSIDNFCSISYQNKKEILYIFNMALNSIIFQHEALNNFMRAYFFYYNDEYNKKINLDNKNIHNLYQRQKLDKINIKPKYLNKYLFKLNKDDLNELGQKSKLKYDEFLEEIKDNKNINEEILDDEGYYYEKQLFTKKNEKKLTKFNFLQAIMLIDEDAYNLDPVRFHYCFLELNKTKKYKIIKNNFKSGLLSKLFEKIDLTLEKNIKNLTFILKKRTNDEGMFITFERSGYDVLSYYANPKFNQNYII